MPQSLRCHCPFTAPHDSHTGHPSTRPNPNQAEADRLAAEQKAKNDAKKALVNELNSARNKMGIAPAKTLSEWGGWGWGWVWW